MALEVIFQSCPTCDADLYIASSGPRGSAECPFCRTPLRFLRRIVDDVVVLTFLPERKQGSTSFGLTDAVVSALGNASRVVANLSHLQCVTRAFLEMLTALHRQLESTGGSLKLCGVSAGVADALAYTAFGQIVEIYPNEQAALSRFGVAPDPSAAVLPCISERSPFDQLQMTESHLVEAEQSL